MPAVQLMAARRTPRDTPAAIGPQSEVVPPRTVAANTEARNTLWEILETSLKERIDSILRKKGVSWQDTDDARHDAICRVIRQIQKLRAAESFFAWLPRLIGNVARQYRPRYRSSEVKPEVQKKPDQPLQIGRKWIRNNVGLLPAKIFAPAVTEEQVNGRRAVLQSFDDSIITSRSQLNALNYPRNMDVKKAVNSLPKHWVRGFWLRADGYSCAEIAAILGRSKSAVYKISKKTRRRLRASLPGYQVKRGAKFKQHPIPIAEVPGLLYLPSFITEAEAAQLEAFVSSQAHWTAIGTKKRRLSFGYKYGISNHNIVEIAPPVAPILHALAVHLVEVGMMRDLADQVVVQEYPAGVGIGEHVDAEVFGPDLVSISLLSPCKMRFKKLADSACRMDQTLEPRSALAITGEARTGWSHEIPAGTVIDRRLSITFRTVVAGACDFVRRSKPA